MDHKTILDSLGGPHAVQAELVNRGIDVAQVTARSWALPGRSIPAKYWTAIVSIAEAKGKPVSYETLAQSVNAAA
tara:strand:- start:876 stop:1100 length:225 start_codon:yes stop_codon:yes gene_type:complete